MARKFLQILLALIKGVFSGNVILQLVVTESIGSIALQKQVFAEGWSGSSTGTHTKTLQIVSANAGVHRADFEFAFGNIGMCLHVAAEKNGNGLLCIIEERNGAKFRHHVLE